ncbi:MAG TPA: hypothetical protein VK457_16725, partial [Chloroflexota bacterium]|nr:hypothetical protein [Chloroflexota bacterium]
MPQGKLAAIAADKIPGLRQRDVVEQREGDRQPVVSQEAWSGEDDAQASCERQPLQLRAAGSSTHSNRHAGFRWRFQQADAGAQPGGFCIQAQVSFLPSR